MKMDLLLSMEVCVRYDLFGVWGLCSYRFHGHPNLPSFRRAEVPQVAEILSPDHQISFQCAP